MTFHIMLTPLILAVVVSAWLMVYIYRQRNFAGKLSLLVLMGGILWWSIFYILELASNRLETNVLMAQLEYVGIVTIPAAWLIFTLHYTGRSHLVNRQVYQALAIHPIVILLLVFTIPYHELIYVDTSLDTSAPLNILVIEHGIIFWLHVIYVYALFAMTTFLIVGEIRNYREAFNRQGIILFLMFSLPWLGNFLYLSRISPFVDLTPFGFALSAITMVIAVNRIQLFDLIPVAHRIVIDSISDGIIVIDGKNRVVEFNRAASQLLNKTASSAVGKDIREVLPQWTLAQDPKIYAQMPSQIITLTHDATQSEIEVSVAAVRQDDGHGFVITLADVTEKRMVERNLRLQSLVFDTITDSVVVADENGIIIDCNPAAEELFGYKKTELIGGRPQKFMESGEYEPTRAMILAAIEENGVWQGETTILHKDGTQGYVEAVTVPLRNNKDELLGYVTVSRDITKRKEAERYLQEAKQAAEAANVAKSSFIANMSHELRTPLTAIIGYSELIEVEIGSVPEEDTIRDLKNIRQASNHLLDLVQGVLDLAKIEGNHIQMMPTQVEVAQIIEEVRGTGEQVASRENSTFTVNHNPAADFLVTDHIRLRQILINLIGNAAKFTTDGTIILDVDQHEIDDKKHIVFKVIDTGIGMSEEDTKKIFEPFQQADTSNSRAYDGAGLGLTISHHFCRLLGGKISVESTLDVGTTFTVSFPKMFHEENMKMPQSIFTPSATASPDQN